MRRDPAHGGGEGCHPGVLAGCGGVVEAGEQVPAFGPCPRQRLRSVCQARDRIRQCRRSRGRAGAGLAGQGPRRYSVVVCNR